VRGTLVSQSSLQDQSIESRVQNVGIEFEDQLSKQFGIERIGGAEPIALVLKQIEDLIKAAPRRKPIDPRTGRERSVPEPPTPEQLLAGVIARTFPFVTEAKALSFVRRDVTVDELISTINFEAGV
jgi:hypothetical protein